MKRNTCLILALIAVLIQSCSLSPEPSTTLANETPSTTGTEPTLTATPGFTKTLPTIGTNPTLTATPALTSIPAPDLFLPNCDRTPQSGFPTKGSDEDNPGWYIYTNAAYGFTFAFPSDWDLIEDTHSVCLRYQSTPAITLVVGFKRDTEAVSIQRTGVGAGDIVTRGTVSFLGQEISRNVLVYQGKDKSVLYNQATEIGTGSLVFTLSLDDFQPDDEAAALSKEVQATADQIVQSFRLEK